MKKRITVSIDEGDFNWLKKECINTSILINCLIKKHIRMKSPQEHTIEKDVDEVFDAKGTD